MMMQDFDSIPVSTQTFIVHNKIKLPAIVGIYESVQINDRVLYATYQQRSKGAHPKEAVAAKSNSVQQQQQQQQPKKKKAMFLNCFSLYLRFDDSKRINVKIFNNAMFQITGCKGIHHALMTIGETFRAMNIDACEDIYIYSVMRNVNFAMPFKVDRDRVADAFHRETSDFFVPAVCPRYMGVKLKVPIKNIGDLDVWRYSYASNHCSYVERIDYKDYLEMTCNVNKLNKQYRVSIAIFQNGKVMLSAPDTSFQAAVYPVLWQNMISRRSSLKRLVAKRKTFLDHHR